MNKGILLVDKPVGMTSFSVVARVRRVLREQAGTKVKIGHTGTLDPFASGLMILVIGDECKNALAYTKRDKTYEATIHLGYTSTTGDPEGELTQVSDQRPTKKQVLDTLGAFQGEITQQPPRFSAIKIGGIRAYQLARKGKHVDMPMRQVTIYTIKLLDYAYPEITFSAHVSSGTYIRSLAMDIGTRLGMGAYCKELRRVSIDRWHVKNAKQLRDLGVEP